MIPSIALPFGNQQKAIEVEDVKAMLEENEGSLSKTQKAIVEGIIQAMKLDKKMKSKGMTLKAIMYLPSL